MKKPKLPQSPKLPKLPDLPDLPEDCEIQSSDDAPYDYFSDPERIGIVNGWLAVNRRYEWESVDDAFVVRKDDNGNIVEYREIDERAIQLHLRGIKKITL